MFAALAVLGGLGCLLWRLGPARDEADFFTAGGALPAWAVALAFAAAEVSAMTVVGVPASAYRFDWRYMQFFAGSAAARVFLALWLLPGFQGAGGLTVYAGLERRFGAGARRWAAGAFLLARLTVTAARLMAAGAILSGLVGGPAAVWVIVLAAASAAGAAWGGLRGAVFGGAAQAVLIAGSGLALSLYAAAAVDGGAAEALRAAATAGKLAVWRWSPEGGFLRGLLHDRAWAPAALLGGFFGSLAAFAGDQEMLQGALNAGPRGGRRALVLSVFAGLGLLASYLALGAALFAFYDQHTALALPGASESIVTHFALQNMGWFWRELLAAALVAAVIDLPLVGAAAAVWSDFGTPPRSWTPRGVVGAAAFLLAAGALVVLRRPGLVPLLSRLGAPAYGPVLGLMLYGRFGPRAAALSAVPAAAAATLAALAFLAFDARGGELVGGHWLPLLAAAAAAGLAHLLSPREGPSAA